jgi:hypothetical protein
MIGTLTNDMTRLCGEIGALHESRQALRSHLAQGRTELQDAVAQMQTGFRNAHAAMANQTQTNLRDFVANVAGAVTALKQGVGALREEILGDIAGAHRAWRGNLPRRSPAQTTAADSPRAEAPKPKRKRN